MLSSGQHGFAQLTAPLEISGSSARALHDQAILWQYAYRKHLPRGYETEALEALSHFPELRNVPIRMRIRKSYATLKTRPTLWGMFMPRGHRSYVITISDKTISTLKPLLFAHLPEAARVGIIGHELSHVLDFSRKSSWNCLVTALDHASPSFVDSLEFNTDKICIQHGLGKDLEAWSLYIRQTMHTKYWRGADYVRHTDTHYERYMNPETIEKYMRESPAQGVPPIKSAY